MLLTNEIIQTAKKFQIDNNLDLTDIPSMLAHDYIHATLGLGVSSAEEELVGSIELVLEHNATWNAEAVELATKLPVSFRSLYLK